jgi:hypothetical protein
VGPDVKAVLDTSVVLATEVAELEGELAISAATIAELHFGVLVTTDPDVRAERLRRLSVLQRSFDALPVDDQVAASYGVLAAAVVVVGRQPRALRRPTHTTPSCTHATPLISSGSSSCSTSPPCSRTTRHRQRASANGSRSRLLQRGSIRGVTSACRRRSDEHQTTPTDIQK